MVAQPNQKPNAIVLSEYERGVVNSVQSFYNIVVALKQSILKEGTDYGKIPNTGDKPTLLLPGMEKLMRALNVYPEYRELCIIRDYDKPLFHYEYECRLIDCETNKVVPGRVGQGLCTSYEQSFRWRWVSAAEVPPTTDKSTLQQRGGSEFVFDFALNKREIGGKYGKTEDYWQMVESAIASGSARKATRDTKSGKSAGYEIDTTLYALPNPTVFDQVNSICKRAQKRALSSAVKGAAGVSEFFTIDLEDFAGFDTSPRIQHNSSTGEVIDGEFEEVGQGKPANITPMPTQQQNAPEPPKSNAAPSNAQFNVEALNKALELKLVKNKPDFDAKLKATGVAPDAPTETIINALEGNQKFEDLPRMDTESYADKKQKREEVASKTISEKMDELTPAVILGECIVGEYQGNPKLIFPNATIVKTGELIEASCFHASPFTDKGWFKPEQIVKGAKLLSRSPIPVRVTVKVKGDKTYYNVIDESVGFAPDALPIPDAFDNGDGMPEEKQVSDIPF